MANYFTSQLPDRIVKLSNGEELLWFSGTDYLGMGHNEEFRKFLSEGFKMYGSHFGSSRNNSLQLLTFEECEDSLANFTKSQSSLLTSSGMWAGQLVMKKIENLISSTSENYPSQIQYYYSPKVHPAIWGNQYSAKTISWTEWARETVEKINSSGEQSSHIICTDSIGSPWVEKLDLDIFQELSVHKEVWLVVDDSHGIGVLGEWGMGTSQKISNMRGLNTIVVASLNKGMGIPAGAIFADPIILNQIRQSPWFSGASPSAPAYSYALKKFLDAGSYKKPFTALQTNIQYFFDQISGINLFSQVENYPVFCSRNTSLFQYLLGNGIMASCFSYPQPTDPPVTRIVVSAIHQKKDLDRLAEVCIKFYNS